MSNHAVNTVMNWSSGKDGALALHMLLQDPHYSVTHLLTTINAEHDRIFMHGVREELLDVQADRIGLPLKKVKLPPSPNDSLYKEAMQKNLSELKAAGVNAAAFGDIFLDDLKVYREEQLATIGITGIFPLWKKDTRELVQLVEQTGIEAIIVCVSEKYLSKEFLGRKIDTSFLNDLPQNVDPCGENGEFHTFVYNAPFFSSPILIQQGEIVYKSYAPSNVSEKWDSGFYFLDVIKQ